MDDGTAMAAAVAQPRPPPPPPPPRAAGSRRGFFSFLKDGVLVTTRNRGLFLPLAALHAARSLALLAARIVALRYMGPTLGLNPNGEDGFRFSALLDKLEDGHLWLMPAAATCLVVKVAIMVLGLVIEADTACAAVASCSAGGPGRTTLTFPSLMGKVRRNLRGPMTTAVFVNVVWWASFVAWNLVALAVLAAGSTTAALVSLLLNSMAFPLVFIYYSVACDVAVVVSVAEPGLRAGGALRRARQLTRGGKKVAQATLHALLSLVLRKTVWKMCEVAMERGPHSIAAALFWLDAVVVYLLVGAVKVLYTATVTAYYFDCNRTQEEDTAAAGHIHVE